MIVDRRVGFHIREKSFGMGSPLEKDSYAELVKRLIYQIKACHRFP